jgi:prepilin signal peptidase PulO-like enzyme (type II secretory pathway)
MAQPFAMPLLLLFTAFAAPVSVIDIRTRRIPDVLTFSAAIVVLLFYCMVNPARLPNALIAAALGAGLFFLIRRITRGLGMGDVKYAALMGLVCGLPALFTAFFAAAVLGLVTALVLKLLDGKHRNRRIPFAPFLSAAVIIALLIPQM